MNWITITDKEQLSEIKSASGHSIIFKHSTRCSISLMAKRKFESEWDELPEESKVYFLDLLSYRDISNTIAEVFQVHHESPQLLLIRDGECILSQSHSDISVDEVNEVLEAQA
ncbi:MAG TPA: bacillithiol system redox-active protein YtxJ [Sphingobacteriaceae bacterium]